MKHILVTGGAGYIGSHTVIELAHAGYKPVIIDNFTNSNRSVLDRLEQITNQKISCYEGNYQDHTLLNKVFDQQEIKGIIHFAAYKAVGESVKQPLKYYGNNVAGLIALLEFLQTVKTNMQFVFSSSCSVYGNPKILPVTEAAPVQPAVSPYGETKQMCEQIIHDTVTVSDNMRALSLRYFNPIGAHDSALIGELTLGVPSNLVPYLTQTVAGIRKELIIYGDDYPTRDGTCIRDYIHVVDLAKAHVSALSHLIKKPTGYYDIFNIGTGSGTTVLEVIQAFQTSTGKKVSYKVGPRRPGDAVEVYASALKAKQELGWWATKSLEEMLVDAWRWQQVLNEKI
jgi:UDP-glucose 4-epimerase